MISAALTTLLQAQVLVNAANYSTYDDHVFSSYKEESDVLFTPQIMVTVVQPMTEWFFNSSFMQMKENTQYNSSDHSVGFEIFPETVDSRTRVSLGGSFNLHLNREEYLYRNFSELKGFGTLKFYPKPFMLTRIDAYALSKSFPDETYWNIPWDHTEYSLYAQHNIFLRTGTTLRASLQGLVRDFSYYRAYIDGYRISGELPTLWQSVVSLRVAQSISSSIGGYTEYQYQYNPSESNPYEPEIMSFSPIDDYFGYEESAWKMNVKYKVLPSLTISSTARLYEKMYRNRPVYAYDFTTESFLLDEEGYYISNGYTREDSGYLLNLNLNWNLRKLFDTPNSLSMTLSYEMQSNNSNDPYFDFVKQSISLYLGVNLQK